MRPNKIEMMMSVLWFSLGLGCLAFAIELYRSFGNSEEFFMVVLIAPITIALSIILYWYIGNGSNIAKWIFSVMYIIGLPASIGVLIYIEFSYISFTQLFLQSAAMYLMWSADSRQWFRHIKEEKKRQKLLVAAAA